MANDHFVPRAYLRGFTPEYLTGKRGAHVVVYSPAFGTSKELSMNSYVACEPEFYDKHPIDRRWSRTIEQSWPALRESLKRRAIDAKTLDQLFWFVAVQMMRTHSYMNHVARFIALRDAKRMPVVNQDRTGTGVFLNMADTGEVMDFVQERWPKAREALETVTYGRYITILFRGDSFGRAAARLMLRTLKRDHVYTTHCEIISPFHCYHARHGLRKAHRKNNRHRKIGYSDSRRHSACLPTW